jgi:hypothetical protein
MTDIFFSYASVNRERVRLIRDALVAQGFEVFWDQQVPTGLDWDTWIRQHLAKSKCAMAFWSTASVASDNVRHEATVAKQHGKLISILLEPLTAEQFPMGLWAQQAANLSDWKGDQGHDEWQKLRREYEAKLMPPWVRQMIDEKDAELVAERARREGVERRDRILQTQIGKEVQLQQELKRELDESRHEVAALKQAIAELNQARSEAEAKQAEAQRLERDNAFDEIAELKATVQKLSQARSDAEAQKAQVQQDLKLEREEAHKEAATLKETIQVLRRARSDDEAKQAKVLELERELGQIAKVRIEENVTARASQANTTTIAAIRKYLMSPGVWLRAGIVCAVGIFVSIANDSPGPIVLAVIAAVAVEALIYQQRQTRPL